MNYYIIIETTATEGVTEHTTLGYTTNKFYAEGLCNMVEDMNDWTEDNLSALESGSLTMSDYFDVNPPVKQIGAITTSIDDMNLIELIP